MTVGMERYLKEILKAERAQKRGIVHLLNTTRISDQFSGRHT